MTPIDADSLPHALWSWSRVLVLQHPHLLLVAGVLCLPLLLALSGILFPPSSSDSSNDYGWFYWSNSDPVDDVEGFGFALLLPFLLPLIRFALLLACYAAFTLGVCWLLVQAFA